MELDYELKQKVYYSTVIFCLAGGVLLTTLGFFILLFNFLFQSNFAMVNAPIPEYTDIQIPVPRLCS